MTDEDAAFREYLAANGFDVSLMGMKTESALEAKIARDPQYDSEKHIGGGKDMDLE